jgi:SAM-dependent methyltransferase
MTEQLVPDILGKALWDYYQGQAKSALYTHSSLDQEEEMPLSHLFRSYKDMPVLEQEALRHCRGKILDIGAGAGIHSLYLQQQGFDVFALDQSAGAIQCCKAQGIKQCLCTDYAGFRRSTKEQYDTLLLLMNGVGLAETLQELPSFLQSMKGLMTSDGQIILDSSDIRYVFEEDEDGGIWVPNDRMYYGDVEYYFSYAGGRGADFKWLFVDPQRLEEAAQLAGLAFELLKEGPHFDYLARLSQV